MRWLGLALACGIALAATTQAAKPVKPPPAIEPGIVFYAQNGYVKLANTDGSGIQNLFPADAMHEFPRPSDLPHNGSYWFLTVRNDGTDNALVALHESGAPVRLDTGPTVRVANTIAVSNQRWLVGDSKVAFIADMGLDPVTQEPIDAGLYIMDIVWSLEGPVVAGAPQLLDWTAPIISAGYSVFQGCAFSADGSTLYFSMNGQLYKADVDTGATVGLPASNFVEPELSADGSKLVGHWAPIGVQTINVDGSGLTTVFPGSGGTVSGPSDNGFYAFWSPTGQNIAFTRDVWLNKRLSSMSEQVTIVSASGTLLGTVGDKAQFTTTLGWRPAR